MRGVVKKADVVAGSSTIYIDDIQLTVQDNTPVAVSGIALDVDNINLAIGQSQQIMESISPDNASNKNVLWQSENPTIATVNNAGLISAIAAGDTEILATTVDGNFAASVDVAVTDPQAATAINITPSSFSLMAGRTKQLAYTIIPTSAQNAAVTWHVLDSTIATVTNTGLVTALKAGTTQISLQAVGNSVTASSQITVTAPDITEPVPEPESSSSSGGSLSVLFMLFLTLIRAIKLY